MDASGLGFHWFVPQIVRVGQNNSEMFSCATSKVVCVGRNYAEHARELSNPLPETPLFFIKPNSSLHSLNESVELPVALGPCHYELEIAVLIGTKTTRVEPGQSRISIAGIGLGLDLTLRELQSELKVQKQPWEKAKAFDGACPVTEFYEVGDAADLQGLDFSLSINGKIAQQGNTRQMLFSIEELIASASFYFSLFPGDILMTGTPAGVGKLEPGDELALALKWQGHQEQKWQTLVSSAN